VFKKKITYVKAVGYRSAYLQFLNKNVLVNARSPKEAEIHKKFDINCIVNDFETNKGIFSFVRTYKGKPFVILSESYNNSNGLLNVDKNFDNLDILTKKVKKIFSRGNITLNVYDAARGVNYVEKTGRIHKLFVSDLRDIDKFSKYDFIVDDINKKNKIITLKNKKIHLTCSSHIKSNKNVIKLDPRIGRIGIVANSNKSYVFYLVDLETKEPKFNLCVNLTGLHDLSLLRPLSDKSFVDRIFADVKRKKIFFGIEDIIKNLCNT